MEPKLMFFIGYVAIYRLSIIIVGTISIVLGYRMFHKNAPPEKTGGGDSQVEGKFGEYGFKMTNMAPGTFFALFGAAIIGVMVAKSPPEISVKFLEPTKTISAAQPAGAAPSAPRQAISEIGIRGDVEDEITKMMSLGAKSEKNGDMGNAVIAYKAAIKVLARSLNNLAVEYHGAGKYAEALVLSRQATATYPENANYLDTLADILFSLGEKAEGLEVMEKAARIDAKFNEKLERFKGEQ